MTEALPPPEETPQRIEALPLAIAPETLDDTVQNKVAATWDALVGAHDFADANAYASDLYTAFFEPEATSQEFTAEQWEDIYASTKAYLQAPVWDPAAIAALRQGGGLLADGTFKDAFQERILQTMLIDLDPAQALFPGGRDAYARAHARGAMVIPWTNGGVLFQANKLHGIGFALDETATAGLHPLRPCNPAFDALPVQAVIADDKLRPAELAGVEELSEGRDILLAEDRAEKIIGFLQTFPNATAVWAVSQGNHARKAHELLRAYQADPISLLTELQELRSASYNPALFKAASKRRTAIETTMQLAEAIQARKVIVLGGGIHELDRVLHDQYGGGRLNYLAIVSDLDDTIIDNNKRREMQHRMVSAALQQLLQTHGLIAPTEP